MITAKLLRLFVKSDGCGSLLFVNDEPCIFTLERTYDNPNLAGAVHQEYNGQFIKIPVGTYTCNRRWYIKGQYFTFEIMVPGHTDILIHKGRIEDHSEGCLLAGLYFDKLNDKVTVEGTQIALKKFLDAMGTVKQFELKVV